MKKLYNLPTDCYNFLLKLSSSQKELLDWLYNAGLLSPDVHQLVPLENSDITEFKDDNEYEWHNAKTDPPKDNIPVLVTYLGIYDKQPYNDEIAYISRGKWRWKSSDENVLVEITHWAELPKYYKNKD